jgi:hypothetical protein
MSKTKKIPPKTRSIRLLGIGISIMLIFLTVGIWIVIDTEVYKLTSFWILSAIETLTAIAVNHTKQFLFTLLGMGLPILLLFVFKQLNGLETGMAVVVFSVVSVVYKVIRGIPNEIRTISGKPIKKKINPQQGQLVSKRHSQRMYEIILPSYLSHGYVETTRNERKRKTSVIVESIFTNEDDEHIIWLTQADGLIPDIKPLSKSVFSEKKIHDILVSFAVIIAKPSRRKQTEEKPEFIEANWSNENINFNFKTDGLSIDEAEKVIASMIR